MANKNQDAPMNFGEITTIRNILMGQQMQEYDGRFEEVQKKVDALEVTLNDKIAALDKRTEARLTELERKISQRFDKLEQLMIGNIKELRQNVELSTKNEKQKIGEIFAEISKRLLQ